MLSTRNAGIVFGSCVVGACCLCPVPPPSCTPPAAAAVDLVFFDMLNLDTGTVEPEPLSGTVVDAGWDLKLTQNVTQVVRAEVLQNPGEPPGTGREIAHLRGKSFGAVTFADVAGAAFVRAAIHEPFDDTRVILIRTDTGNVFKLGSIGESANSHAFRYARLSASDCP